jgi:hypothetical protein
MAQHYMRLAKRGPKLLKAVTSSTSKANTKHVSHLSFRALKAISDNLDKPVAESPENTEQRQHDKMMKREKPKPCPLALGNHSAGERFDHGFNMILGVFEQCDPFAFEQFAGALRELLKRHDRQREAANFNGAITVQSDEIEDAEILEDEGL